MAEQVQDQGPKSYFDGTMLQWLGWTILGNLLCLITLFLALPWALCFIERWRTNHTVINGQRLKFTGSGGSLFGHYILWWFLSIITIGIFALWVPTKIEKWKAERTTFA